MDQSKYIWMVRFLASSMIIGRIGKKGQIVIPKEIRERLHIEPNDFFSFNVRANTILLKKV